jgi:PP-loop superfamily ATP-utilizing enzyme
MKLIREADLAADWGYTHEQFRYLRRKHDWARVEISRQDIRYTEDQIEAIVHQLTVRGKRQVKAVDAGQTSRSKARAS